MNVLLTWVLRDLSSTYSLDPLRIWVCWKTSSMCTYRPSSYACKTKYGVNF